MSFKDVIKMVTLLGVFGGLGYMGCADQAETKKEKEQKDVQKQTFLSSDYRMLTVKDELNKDVVDIRFTAEESKELGKILHKEDSNARVFVGLIIEKMTNPIYRTPKGVIDNALRSTFHAGMSMNTDQDVEGVVKAYQIFNGAIKRGEQEKVQEKKLVRPSVER